jgi:hypothetical protein
MPEAYGDKKGNTSGRESRLEAVRLLETGDKKAKTPDLPANSASLAMNLGENQPPTWQCHRAGAAAAVTGPPPGLLRKANEISIGATLRAAHQQRLP